MFPKKKNVFKNFQKKTPKFQGGLKGAPPLPAKGESFFFFFRGQTFPKKKRFFFPI